MALSGAERQARFRARQALRNGESNELRAMLLAQQAELASLRNEVVTLRDALRARANLNLPSEDESYKKTPPLPSGEYPLGKGARPPKKSPRLLIADWQPSEAHRQLAWDEGHDGAWVDREADRYRDQQANAKLKHRDLEAGFRNWIRNAPQFEPKENGHANGRANEPSLTAAAERSLRQRRVTFDIVLQRERERELAASYGEDNSGAA